MILYVSDANVTWVLNINKHIWDQFGGKASTPEWQGEDFTLKQNISKT